MSIFYDEEGKKEKGKDFFFAENEVLLSKRPQNKECTVTNDLFMPKGLESCI